MNLPPRLFAIPVTIESYSGQGAYGDAYGEPVTVLGHITGGQRVQSGSTSDEVVSSRRLLLPNPARLADGSGTVDPVPLLTPESRVKVGASEATASNVVPHIKPGTSVAAYVSATLD